MSVGERRQARRCFCVVCSRTVYLGPADDPYCPVCTTLAVLMPRLTGPVEMGPSGIKLQLAELPRTGVLAGYSQEDIRAAMENSQAGRDAQPRLPTEPAEAPGPRPPLPNLPGEQATPQLNSANLANALYEKFLRTQDLKDLDEALEAITRAIALTPSDSPWLSLILSLTGQMYTHKYMQTGGREDLDRAVETLRRALEISPADSPTYSQVMSQLAHAVQLRYETTGDMADHDQVIAMLQQLEHARRKRVS